MSESTDIMETATEPGFSQDESHVFDLPRLLAPEASADPAEIDAARAAQMRFKVSGESSADGLKPIDGLFPIHMYPVRHFERVRADYPVFLPSDGGTPVSLTFVIDELCGRSDKDGDEREHFKHAVLLLDAELRAITDSGGRFELLPLWNTALERLAARLPADEFESVRNYLRDARKKLEVSGTVVSFGHDAVVALIDRAYSRFVTSRTKVLQKELEELLTAARALLDVDQSERPDAHSPDALEKSVGEPFKDELDFEALSDLMDKGPHGVMLSDDRRSRIEAVSAVLAGELQKLQEIAKGKLSAKPVSSPDQLTELRDAHLERCLALVKAVQVVRLEVENEYDAKLHGPQFEALHTDQLSKNDLFSLPVVPAIVKDSDIAEIESLLQTSLDTAEPVKVILLVDSPMPAGERIGLSTSCGQRLLAAGRPAGAVFQVSLANLEEVKKAFQEALEFAGPAVVCLYTGADFGADYHPYLRAAAARDARVVPSFANNPAKGPNWATRFGADGNPDLGQIWPASSIRYTDSNGDTKEENWAFTAVDFMAMDRRFFHAFRQIPIEQWHDRLVGIEDYTRLDNRALAIPYLLMVDSDGVLVRVICTEKLVEIADHVRDRWQSIQELAGIQNSHALRLVEKEKKRMEAETADRIAKVEADLRGELEQKTGVLAEQIVSNIAAGLLSTDLTGTPVRSEAKTAVPVRSSQAEPAVDDAQVAEPVSPPAEDEDEDDDLSFDEAYIETPRCTTCDECTTINPRMFAYNENKQAFIADINAGSFRELVMAAEKCPVKIIHTGKPMNPDEPHLDELTARAEAFR